MILYNEVLINQSLLKKNTLITVASIPSKLRVIGRYVVSNLTLQHHDKRAAT